MYNPPEPPSDITNRHRAHNTGTLASQPQIASRPRQSLWTGLAAVLGPIPGKIPGNSRVQPVLGCELQACEWPLTWGFVEWGGRDSNPRPRDYETAGICHSSRPQASGRRAYATLAALGHPVRRSFMARTMARHAVLMRSTPVEAQTQLVSDDRSVAGMLNVRAERAPVQAWLTSWLGASSDGGRIGA
jgi:hypothetical protein